MHEELIKNLRRCGAGVCDKSELRTPFLDCQDDLLKQAADAIEEMNKCLDGVSEDNDELCKTIEELSKPRWIPVTDRLPEEYVNVLCYYEYYRYGEYNCMFRTIDRGYYGDGIWGGEAGQGHKNKVLAWMPLPEPPKEDKP